MRNFEHFLAIFVSTFVRILPAQSGKALFVIMHLMKCNKRKIYLRSIHTVAIHRAAYIYNDLLKWFTLYPYEQFLDCFKISKKKKRKVVETSHMLKRLHIMFSEVIKDPVFNFIP